MREKKKTTCKARCRTDPEDIMILDHEHVEEEDRTIERQALRQTCRQKAVAEPCDNHQVGEQGNSASTLKNTSSWPRKSCENIGANVTPKLSANAPHL